MFCKVTIKSNFVLLLFILIILIILRQCFSRQVNVTGLSYANIHYIARCGTDSKGLEFRNFLNNAR